MQGAKYESTVSCDRFIPSYLLPVNLPPESSCESSPWDQAWANEDMVPVGRERLPDFMIITELQGQQACGCDRYYDDSIAIAVRSRTIKICSDWQKFEICRQREGWRHASTLPSLVDTVVEVVHTSRRPCMASKD